MVIYGKESRRAKGEGSIYARANGTYAIKYNGKYRYAKTKTEAREKLEEMKLEEKLALNDRTKMATAVQEWLDTKVLSMKPTSYDRLERTVRIAHHSASIFLLEMNIQKQTDQDLCL